MKPLSEEVKHRRCKSIGHIRRQDQNDDRKIAIRPEGKGIKKARDDKENINQKTE